MLEDALDQSQWAEWAMKALPGLTSAGSLRPEFGSARLKGDALSFILKDQPLAREWLRLSLIKAARENPSIRRSADFQRLPQEYKALLDQAPDAVRQIMEEIGSFERGSIGRKRVDVADFKLDTGEATVSDPTQASTPWHRFKTLFYARVIKELTGFKVDAMDISGNPLAVPKVMLDQP